MRTYTAKQAQERLQVDVNKFYRLVHAGHIKAIQVPASKHSIYEAESVDRLARELNQFKDVVNEDTAKLQQDGTVTFRQATPEDMDGVYAVAHELFGHTTPADQRKPMIEACPQGNYVLLRGDEIVAYIHIQPLKTDRLKAFMDGSIRGWDLTYKDLDCFAPGKSVECLVKSIGATAKYGIEAQRYFGRALLRGTMRALIEMGRHGVRITKFYATSERDTGISICLSADMKVMGEPLGKRLPFVVDIDEADVQAFKRYREALAQWEQGKSA